MFYFEMFRIILNPSSVKKLQLKAFLVLMKLLSLSQFYAPKFESPYLHFSYCNQGH